MQRGKQAANITTEIWKTEEYRKRIIKSVTDELLEQNVPYKRFSVPDLVQSIERFEEKANASAETEEEYLTLVTDKVKSIRVLSQKAAHAKSQLRNPSVSAGTKDPIIDIQEDVYQRLQFLKKEYYTVVLALYQKLCRKLQNGSSTQNSREMDRYRHNKSAMEYLFSLFELSKSDITVDMKDRPTEADNYIQILLKTNKVANKQQSPNVQPKEMFFGPPNCRFSIVNNMFSQDHQAGIGSSQPGNVNQPSVLKGPGNAVQQPTFLAPQAISPFGQSINAPMVSATKPFAQTYPAPQANVVFGQSIRAPTISPTRPVGQTYPATQATAKLRQSVKAPKISLTKPLNQTYVAPQATGTFGQSINAPTTSATKPFGPTQLAPQTPGAFGQSITAPTIRATEPFSKTQLAPRKTGAFGQSVKAPTISATRPVAQTNLAPQATGAFGESIKAPTISATRPVAQTNLAPQETGEFGSVINNLRISPSPLIKDKSNLNQVNNVKPTLGSEEHSPAAQRLINALTSISPESLRKAVNEMEEVIRLNDEIPELPDLYDELGLPTFVVPEGWKIPRNFVATAYENPIICPSTGDGFNQFGAFQFSASKDKCPRTAENPHLLAEIKEINNRLLDCEVIISEKNNAKSAIGVAFEQLHVKIIYNAVTISQNLISQFTSDRKSLINPLQLLVPASYPSSSLVILDELPMNVSNDLRALFERAKAKLRISLLSMNKPWLVKDVARAWERCAREAILDYAHANGGGTFSSMYGGWEHC